MLSRQVGISNFEPLRNNFKLVYNSAHAFTPSPFADLPWQSSPVFRDEKTKMPQLAFSLTQCVSMVKLGYKNVTEGKFQSALREFRKLLYVFPLLVVDTKAEVADVDDLRNICSSYLTAIRLELARKAEKKTVRQAALAAYFTKCDLQPIHRILALKVAIKFSFVSKNYKTTAGFCRSLLELAAMHKSPMVAKLVVPREIRGALQKCEKLNTDANAIDFDETKAFFICARSFTPVYTGRQESSACPFCLTKYHKRFEDSLCDNCELAKIGSVATGLRSCADA
jgi:coatomer protein complex subunit alpha (xenin)